MHLPQGFFYALFPIPSFKTLDKSRRVAEGFETLCAKLFEALRKAFYTTPPECVDKYYMLICLYAYILLRKIIESAQDYSHYFE